MAAPRAWLIDTSIYIFRAWFSLPDNWHSSEGRPLNAVYGYCGFLLDFLQRNQPEHCVAAFDESLGSCFRNDILPSYKCRRELPDEALAFQLKACRQITELLGLACFGGSRYEADDYLASLGRQYREQGIAVSVVTRDKDLGQMIVTADDRWCDVVAGVSLDGGQFAAKYGVRPDQFADYLALVGDPVDDIPGVPGIGAKTAVALLQAFGNLDQLELRLDEVAALKLRGAARVQTRLREHWPQLILARRLTRLEDAIPQLQLPPSFRLEARRLDALSTYLEELNLKGPLTRRCLRLQQGLSHA